MGREPEWGIFGGWEWEKREWEFLLGDAAVGGGHEAPGVVDVAAHDVVGEIRLQHQIFGIHLDLGRWEKSGKGSRKMGGEKKNWEKGDGEGNPKNEQGKGKGENSQINQEKGKPGGGIPKMDREKRKSGKKF